MADSSSLAARNQQLQQAIRRNDFINLKKLLNRFPETKTAQITDDKETVVFLVAKQGKKSAFLLDRLPEIMTNEALTRVNCRGNTALHAAAVVGNVVGARILVSKKSDLTNISNNKGFLPLHLAIGYAHRDLVLFLLSKTKAEVEPNPFADQPGAKLVRYLIVSGFYDAALVLIKKYSALAWHPDFPSLKAIAQEPTAFRSGVKLGFLKNVIYTCFLGVNRNSLTPNFTQPNEQGVCRRFFSKVLDIIVPQLKNIRRMKASHLQAMELMGFLCEGAMRLSSSETSVIVRRSFLLAAQYGISEVVEEILKSLPNAIVDEDKSKALHLAVTYRHENVFNVINGLAEESFLYSSRSSDSNGNNILHLAGSREKQNRLDLVSSAVLQMQRELKWFQEVERLVQPDLKKEKNGKQMTPLEVFQEDHKDMEVYEGQWMNGVANSCTVATTIIGTIAFAAAITVPGGNKGDGSPIFSGGAAFIIFAISNALALFSSICTLLIFLSILTSRYATIDYLYSLPNKLIMGLITLFFSITSMIISFSATLYLVFAQNNNWILIPIVAFALLPMTFFGMLQFPLLLNMMKSTYGDNILSPKKNLPLFRNYVIKYSGKTM